MTSHLLPPQPSHQLEAQLMSVFQSLCARVDAKDIVEIRHQVLTYCELIQSELQINEFIDVDLAQRIADIILLLLDDYTTFSEEQQLMIVGAARYFAQADDADPDMTSVLGFDDDVVVLNYVLAAIGRQELRFEL